jgi:voltage-gated potassium channel
MMVKPITVLLGLFSPTYLYAARRKVGRNRLGRARFIGQMNCAYLIAGVMIAVATFVVTRSGTGHLPWVTWWPLMTPVAWYLVSRSNEVFLAFYKDAFDKLKTRRRPSSALAWSTRVRLALNSYVELVLNFAVLYAMLPADMWQEGSQRPKAFADLLSYSALTITTSGGGGFVARHWLPQFMTVYEVLCGLILLVVSFTKPKDDTAKT